MTFAPLAGLAAFNIKYEHSGRLFENDANNIWMKYRQAVCIFLLYKIKAFA